MVQKETIPKEKKRLLAYTAGVQFYMQMNRDVEEKVVKQAVESVLREEHESESDIAKATVRQLQMHMDIEEKRRWESKVGKPKGSPEPLASAAYAALTRKWYKITVGKSQVYVTFNSQDELERFKKGDSGEQYDMLLRKCTPKRREVFQQGAQQPADKVIGDYVTEASRLARITLDEDQSFTRTAGGNFVSTKGRGGNLIARKRKAVEEKVARVAVREADEIWQATVTASPGTPVRVERPGETYAFTITTADGRTMRIGHARLTEEQWMTVNRAKKGDKMAMELMPRIIAHISDQRDLTIDRQKRKNSMDILFEASVAGITGVYTPGMEHRKKAPETTQTYAFTITTADGRTMRIGHARLTEEQWMTVNRAKKGDKMAMRQMPQILSELSEQDGITINRERTDEANGILFGAAAEGITGVYTPGREPKRTREPTQRYVFSIRTGEGDVRKIGHAELTEKEWETIQRAKRGDKKALEQMRGIIAMLSEQRGVLIDGIRPPDAGTILFGAAVDGIAGVYGPGYGTKPGIAETQERRVAVDEARKKGTRISVAIRLNRYGEANLGYEYGDQPFRYNTIVFSFQPTAEEIAAYNKDPKTFDRQMRVVFGSAKKRREFLEKHKKTVSLYFPPQGIRAPISFTSQHSIGAVIDGSKEGDYLLIRHIVGDYIDTRGESYPDGFKIMGTAATRTRMGKRSMTFFERTRELQESLPLGKIARTKIKIKPPKMRKIETTREYHVDFTSKGKKVRAYIRLTKAEVVRINRIISEGDTKLIYGIFYEKLGRVARLTENGKDAKDPDLALGLYLEGNIKVTGVSLAPRKEEPADRIKKRTSIAVAIRLNNFDEVNLGMDSRGKTFKYNAFVLSFEPTADEISGYNEDPEGFGQYILATLQDSEQRAEFLRKHKGKLTIYIPSEAIMGPDDVKMIYGQGIEISGNTKERDRSIRVGIAGKSLDAQGFRHPNGFRISGFSTVAPGASSTERMRQMEAAFRRRRTPRRTVAIKR